MDDFVLTLWTSDPDLARCADEAGVNRVGLDLERLGKAERQAGLGTWLSPHTVQHLPPVAKALTNSELFARTNPLHQGSAAEVDELLSLGTSVLMLPMFTNEQEVADFVDIVAGRAKVVLLLETSGGAERIERVVEIEGVDEVHIGLNDLALALRLPNRFAVLTTDLVLEVSETVRDAGLRFGFGGVGRVDDSLPIPPDLIYAQYARLGARAALISRSFFSSPQSRDRLAPEIERTRARLAEWGRESAASLEAAHTNFISAVEKCPVW